MPRPASVLDGGRPRGEVVSLQNLLQRISGSRVARGPDSDQNARIRRRQFQMLSLAQTLSRFIPNTNGCMSTNSPCTGYISLKNLLLQNAPLSDLKCRFQMIKCFLPALQRHLRLKAPIHIERVARLIGLRIGLAIIIVLHLETVYRESSPPTTPSHEMGRPFGGRGVVPRSGKTQEVYAFTTTQPTESPVHS